MTDKPAESVLIIGCGDIGRRVGRLWRERGAIVRGLTRNPHPELSQTGIEPLTGDLDRPDTLPALRARDALLYYFAPPPGHGSDDLRLAAVLDRLDGTPARWVYISTSGVYGDCGGEWVDEARPPRPGTDRAQRRLAAEERLRAWSDQTGVPLVILRVGGIYGPGRLPVERVKAGTPMLRADLAGWTNRIHADDLARVCLAAGERGRGIYNVSDGRPGSIPEYYRELARALGVDPPPELDWEAAQATLSPGLLSYLSESRRLDTTRMRRAFGVGLEYPDLATGLAAVLASPDRGP